MKEPDELAEDTDEMVGDTLEEMLADAQVEPTVLKLPKEVVEVLATYEKEHSVRRKDMFALALEAQRGREKRMSAIVARLTEDPGSFRWPLEDPLLCLLVGFVHQHAIRWHEKTVREVPRGKTAMNNAIVPYNMSKALQEIDRLRALIAWRCKRDDIRQIHELLKKDIADLRAAVDALDRAYQTEGTRSNGTDAVGKDVRKL
jgi:hypothetical protein